MNDEENKKQTENQLKKREIIRRILFVVFSVIFVTSAAMLTIKLVQYSKGKKIYEDSTKYIENESVIVVPSAESDSQGEAESQEPVVLPIKKFDYDEIRKESPDTIGWISVPYCDINYPIVQGIDNDHYLEFAYTGEYSISGSIFLDYRQNPEMTDKNSFIYGHSMKNGTMFGMLRKLDGTKYFNTAVENNDIRFFIYLKDTVQIYEMIAIVDTTQADTPELFDVNYPIANDEESGRAYIDLVMSKAHKTTGVTPKWDDKFVTLYTCQNATGPERHLVIGRLVDTVSSEDFEE